MPDATSEVRTADLALAAYLTQEGYKHKCLELLDPHHSRTQAVWVFDGNGDVHGAVETYQDGGASVEPRDFMKAVRSVRDELYTFLRSNEG